MNDIPKEIQEQITKIELATINKIIKSIVFHKTYCKQKIITIQQPNSLINIERLYKMLTDRNLKCEIVNTYIVKKYVGGTYQATYKGDYIGDIRYYFEPHSLNEFNSKGMDKSTIKAAHKIFFTKEINKYQLSEIPYGIAIEINLDDLHMI